MKRWTGILADAVFRGVLGLVVFYVLQQLCTANGLFVFAGINLLSFLTVAVLGIPGFLLVLSVGLIHFW